VNWSRKKKWWNMCVISYLTFLTPLTSSIVAPAQGLVMKDFSSASRTLASFVVSIYLVGFAVGPLFLAPLSEIYGRLRVYQVGTLIFTIWNIAGALAPNVSALLVFRLFAGISGSGPVTLGAGSVADMFARQERGVAMSIYGLGPLLGPVIGPIAGGYLSQAQGWRWVFWLLAIVVSGDFHPSTLRPNSLVYRYSPGLQSFSLFLFYPNLTNRFSCGKKRVELDKRTDLWT
jgi:multidrug resistance protein